MESDNLVFKEKGVISQMKSKNKYEILKNDYFLQKVFNNVEKKKLLNIVKYNINIKKRINININDFKEYSEKYSSIEIEIKLVNNKYSKFINIKDEDEKYYHIYLNNNKEEIKMNNINKDEEIKIIKIIIDYQVKSFEGLFYYCKCIESINFKKFYRNNINNMRRMLALCRSLKEINLNNFNSNNVTNMENMFASCSSLEELNLNNFNTNNVTNMSYMFSGCSNDLKRKIKSKNKYENLKNDYFLQKVFNNLEKKKLLNIVKYNKNIKKE